MNEAVRVDAGLGRVQALERDIYLGPTRYRHDGTVPGIVYCHGGGQDAGCAALPATYPGQYQLLMALAEWYPIAVCDLGGTYTYGNATAKLRVAAAKAWLQAWGAKAGAVFVGGTSMGNVLALNYTRDHRVDVLAAFGFLPGTDVEYWWANNTAGTGTAAVNAAFGGAYVPAAHGPLYNPVDYAAADLQGLPWHGWAASDDDICVPSTVTALEQAIGVTATVTDLGASGGHSEASLLEIDPAEVLDFLADHAAA